MFSKAWEAGSLDDLKKKKLLKGLLRLSFILFGPVVLVSEEIFFAKVNERQTTDAH